MERLAAEEDGHRAALEARYRRIAGSDFRFDPASPDGPQFDFVKKDVFTQASALEVVSVAISAEKEAISFYGKQRESVTDPEDIRLLDRLVKFETGHKKKLQREYEKLEKRFSWG